MSDTDDGGVVPVKDLSRRGSAKSDGEWECIESPVDMVVGTRDSSQHETTCGDAPIDRPSGQQSKTSKSYQRHPKPPYSYIALIAMAIRDSTTQRVTLAEINEYLMNKFEFFRGSYTGWKNSIRHNLSLNECFVKVLRDPTRPWGKDNYWTLNSNSEYTFADGVFKRRRRRILKRTMDAVTSAWISPGMIFRGGGAREVRLPWPNEGLGHYDYSLQRRLPAGYPWSLDPAPLHAVDYSRRSLASSTAAAAAAAAAKAKEVGSSSFARSSMTSPRGSRDARVVSRPPPGTTPAHHEEPDVDHVRDAECSDQRGSGRYGSFSIANLLKENDARFRTTHRGSPEPGKILPASPECSSAFARSLPTDTPGSVDLLSRAPRSGEPADSYLDLPRLAQLFPVPSMYDPLRGAAYGAGPAGPRPAAAASVHPGTAAAQLVSVPSPYHHPQSLHSPALVAAGLQAAGSPYAAYPPHVLDPHLIAEMIPRMDAYVNYAKCYQDWLQSVISVSAQRLAAGGGGDCSGAHPLKRSDTHNLP